MKKKMKCLYAVIRGCRKIFMIMRIILIAILISTLQVVAATGYSQSVRLSLEMHNSTLKEVLSEIEDQSEFYFLYNSEWIDVQRKVDVYAKDEKIESILSRLFSDGTVNVMIRDRHILLNPAENQNPAMQAAKEVSGKVTDLSGFPVPGVSIIIEGTTNGSVTGPDGRFSLKDIPNNAVLVFSFVGMRTQKVPVAGKSTIDVVMEDELVGIEEVVAVGYGTIKKVNLTGAVNQIGAEALQDRPLPNMTQIIQGTIPNLNVDFSNGRPGKDASINIRGNTSINGGDPLVLIDGIPGSINRVNPRDVESVTVLKDAAASAIYGARGAFGVILVTTKSNKKGGMQISYGNNFGWATPTVSTDFITSGYDWTMLNDESFKRATGNTYSRYTEEDYAELEKRRYDKTENPERPWVVVDNRKGKDQYVYYGNTDWYNYMFHKWQPSREHNVSLSGGDEELNFLISGRYYEKGGIMKINRDRFDFYSFRTKINAELNKWLSVSSNTQFNAKKYAYYGFEGGEKANFNQFAFHGSPTYVPVNPDGTYTGRGGLNSYWMMGGGIVGTLLEGKTRGEDKNYELTSTVEATVKISKSINVVGNYSYNMYVTQDFYRSAPSKYSLYPGVVETAAAISINQLKEQAKHDQYYVANVYGNYTQSFGNHNLKLMAGYNQEKKTYKTNTETKSNLISEDLNDFDLATGDMTVTGGASEWALIGVFSRLNYDFKGKYLIEMNGRYDGTSRFPKGDHFGFFPSFSAGWRISEENFFSPVQELVNNLKIRGSYGSLGNQQVATYAYISSMGTSTMNYLMNGTKLQYTSVPAPVSASLTWEKTSSTNIGVDAEMLDSRLAISFDTYVRKTIRMLTKGKTLPAVFGATEPRENAADLETRGFELSLRWKDRFRLASRPFSYDFSFILSDYHAKITRYDNPARLLSEYYVGQELGEMWGYSIDGYFASDEEAAAHTINQSRVNARIRQAPGEWGKLRAGDMRFRDLKSDGEINNGQNTLDDHGDLRKIGNSQPRYAFGINMGADWNGFDLSAFFQGIGERHWYPGSDSDKFWGPYARPYYTFVPKNFKDKIWSAENPDSYFPTLRGYTAYNANSSLKVWNDRYLQNTAYVRLKNLTIGYTLPASVMKKIQAVRCRIYFSGENLFTLTKLDTKYVDPEQVERNSDTRDYPFSKTYSLGLDITF